MWPCSTWNLLSMQRKQQHRQTITTQQCTSPGSTCCKRILPFAYLSNRWWMLLNAYIKALNNLHSKTKDDWWPRSNISKCYRFFEECIIVFHAPAQFHKIEMHRILLLWVQQHREYRVWQKKIKKKDKTRANKKKQTRKPKPRKKQEKNKKKKSKPTFSAVLIFSCFFFLFFSCFFWWFFLSICFFGDSVFFFFNYIIFLLKSTFSVLHGVIILLSITIILAVAHLIRATIMTIRAVVKNIYGG